MRYLAILAACLCCTGCLSFGLGPSGAIDGDDAARVIEAFKGKKTEAPEGDVSVKIEAGDDVGYTLIISRNKSVQQVDANITDPQLKR